MCGGDGVFALPPLASVIAKIVVYHEGFALSVSIAFGRAGIGRRGVVGEAMRSERIECLAQQSRRHFPKSAVPATALLGVAVGVGYYRIGIDAGEGKSTAPEEGGRCLDRDAGRQQGNANRGANAEHTNGRYRGHGGGGRSRFAALALHRHLAAEMNSLLSVIGRLEKTSQMTVNGEVRRSKFKLTSKKCAIHDDGTGIGKSHGLYGFKEFSNERAVLKQWSPVAGVDLMMTQYGTRT